MSRAVRFMVPPVFDGAGAVLEAWRVVGAVQQCERDDDEQGKGDGDLHVGHRFALPRAIRNRRRMASGRVGRSFCRLIQASSHAMSSG